MNRRKFVGLTFASGVATALQPSWLLAAQDQHDESRQPNRSGNLDVPIWGRKLIPDPQNDGNYLFVPDADGKINEMRIRTAGFISNQSLLQMRGHANTYFISHPRFASLKAALPARGDGRLFDQAGIFTRLESPESEHRVFYMTLQQAPESFRAIHFFAGGDADSHSLIRWWLVDMENCQEFPIANLITEPS